MTPVWLRVRFGLRERAGAWIALALILGVLGGAVIAAVAGARRTAGAYDGFLRSQRAYQQFMFTYNPAFGGGITADQIRSLPEVETVIEGVVFDAKTGDAELVMRGSADPRLDRSLNSVNVLAGRLPDPDVAEEILVPVLLAEEHDFAVGDTLTLTMSQDPSAEPIVVRARVVGIGIAPGEFPPENDIRTGRWIHVSPAFVRDHRAVGGPFAYVFLKRGDADLRTFQAGLERLAGGQPVIGYQQESLTHNVRRAHHLQSVTLSLLALLLGVTVTALVGQTVSRMTWMGASEHPVLASLGMTRWQLFSAAVSQVLMVAAASAIVAGGVAFGLSPLSPSGRARAAIVDPGFAFDATAIGLGALALIVVAVTSSVVPAWRSARATARGADSRATRSVIVESLLRAGAPPTTGIGVRFALEPGRGRTSVPTRATMLGATLAVAAIALTLTFGGSLRHLLDTPRLYGAVYDGVGRSLEEPIPRERAGETLEKIRALPEVRAATEGAVGIPMRVNGTLADGAAFGDDRAFLPPLLRGRYPKEDGEIVLGVQTLKKLNVEVGDTVQVSALGTATRPFAVVGMGVIPPVGHSGNLGEGSLVTIDAVRVLFGGDDSMGDVLIKLRPGASLQAAQEGVAQVTDGAITYIAPPLTPADLVSFGGQRNLPLLLAAILALMAMVTIGHALVLSISRRRRDIAIVKATGFTRRQAWSTIGWQATTLMLVGIVFGLPAGVAAGRALWNVYANSLGIVAESRPPVSLLVLTVPAAIALSNLIALLPGRRAARLEPAIALRTE